MKMRFWQKTYIFTLVLFLACLNLSILTLAVYSYNRSVDNTEQVAMAEQQYIVMSFERDYKALLEVNKNPNLSLLMNSYGKYYGDKGLYLMFEEKDKILYSNFPYEYKMDENGIAYTELEEEKYILISNNICDKKICLIYAKNIEDIYVELREIMTIYAITAVGVSIIFSCLLFFVLKKLSEPLDELKNVTQNIENGDFSVKVEEKGDDEFTLLAKSFNAMLDKINEQMQTLEEDGKRKQELVDNMAHELRTPLTSIYGYAEYLERAVIDEEKKNIATQYIMSEANRLKKISEIQLDSAYIRGNPPEMSNVDLASILKDVKDKLNFYANKKNVIIECNTQKMNVYGNEVLLSMLFYNLTENAIKACYNNGIVKLVCYDNVVKVEDDGKGMTEEELKHIVEPFYRTDKARARTDGGTGLGLALCNQIVNVHKAILTFESKPKEGTKAIVVFTK